MIEIIILIWIQILREKSVYQTTEKLLKHIRWIFLLNQVSQVHGYFFVKFPHESISVQFSPLRQKSRTEIATK